MEQRADAVDLFGDQLRFDIGLTSVELCIQGKCIEQKQEAIIGQRGFMIIMAARTAKWGGVTLALILLIFAWMAYTDEDPPKAWVLGVGVIVLLSALYFFLKVSDGANVLFGPVGWPAYAFFLGCIGAIIAALLPHEGEAAGSSSSSWKASTSTNAPSPSRNVPKGPPAAGASLPTCPSCGNPARYSAAQKEYFCDPCVRYVDP